MRRAELAAIDAPHIAEFTKPAALRGAGGAALAPFNFARQILQGACAGLLTLLGATHLAASVEKGEVVFAPAAGFSAESFRLLLENYAAGGLPGALEIVGAAGLFLNAGRGAGRVIGLLGFVAIAVAHANGLTHEEWFASIGGWSQFLGADATAIFDR